MYVYVYSQLRTCGVWVKVWEVCTTMYLLIHTICIMERHWFNRRWCYTCLHILNSATLTTMVQSGSLCMVSGLFTQMYGILTTHAMHGLSSVPILHPFHATAVLTLPLKFILAQSVCNEFSTTYTRRSTLWSTVQWSPSDPCLRCRLRVAVR